MGSHRLGSLKLRAFGLEALCTSHRRQSAHGSSDHHVQAKRRAHITKQNQQCNRRRSALSNGNEKLPNMVPPLMQRAAYCFLAGSIVASSRRRDTHERQAVQGDRNRHSHDIQQWTGLAQSREAVNALWWQRAAGHMWQGIVHQAGEGPGDRHVQGSQNIVASAMPNLTDLPLERDDVSGATGRFPEGSKGDIDCRDESMAVGNEERALQVSFVNPSKDATSWTRSDGSRRTGHGNVSNEGRIGGRSKGSQVDQNGDPAAGSRTLTEVPSALTEVLPVFEKELAANGVSVAAAEASVEQKRARSAPPNVPQTGPLVMVTKPLPRVLLLHTGGTLGMDPAASFEEEHDGSAHLIEGTGGKYEKGLQPRRLLADLLEVIPELRAFANLDVRVVFNKDSCRITPADWVALAKAIHHNRDRHDAFIVAHGTDTMAYTASAISLMLAGLNKPVVVTGSQLPLLMPRSDARQNLIDSLTCATAGPLKEVSICFGGLLFRGNRCQKTNSSSYKAFSSPTYPPLATLGVTVDWNTDALWRHAGVYRPRFQLNSHVIRVPIVPGSDPRQAYGDLHGRGIQGIVLEAFGVGNMPDTPALGWLPWLRQQRKKGLQVYLSTQCDVGNLHPEMYRSGSMALQLGVEAGPQMTPECAVVKMMLCLAHPDIPLGQPIAGEL